MISFHIQSHSLYRFHDLFLADTVCVGYSIDIFASGEIVEEILNSLHNQLCGCTHVTGSIEIDMFGNDNYTNLTEDSFNFLYHVEEISGVVRFQNIPTVNRIVLPNLRMIRGDDLIETAEGRSLALVLLNTRIGAIVLPKLTEVTRGDVRFQNTTSSMCNYRTVNWNDIIDNGQLNELLACNTSRHEGEGTGTCLMFPSSLMDACVGVHAIVQNIAVIKGKRNDDPFWPHVISWQNLF